MPLLFGFLLRQFHSETIDHPALSKGHDYNQEPSLTLSKHSINGHWLVIKCHSFQLVVVQNVAVSFGVINTIQVFNKFL